MNGNARRDTRDTLAGGDRPWATTFMKHIRASVASDRLEAFTRYIDQAFVLTSSRMFGSDFFFNSRMQVYLRFMRQQAQSKQQAAHVYELTKRTGGVNGCCIHAAARALDIALRRINVHQWALRSGNMTLALAVMVTDMMLSLNYHDSQFEGARNGIGATVTIRDGGGGYRSLTKKQQSTWEMNIMNTKMNGCGADTVIAAVKKVSRCLLATP